MTILLGEPSVAGLGEVLAALRDWLHDGAPMQLHPGDLGWHWRFGGDATAAAVRTWSRDGEVLAAGLLDGSALLRMAVAPDARDDDELAGRLVADVSEPRRDLLARGTAFVEAPRGALVRELLVAQGWQVDEPWTPLRRDLTAHVPDAGVRIEVVGPEQAHVRTAVQRASFDRSTFTDERWRVMAAGLPYADARCLVAYDDRSEAVATVRELGSSSAVVCTPSSNVGAVATYASAGFQPLPEVPDLRRDP
jgi:hypothetical protein